MSKGIWPEKSVFGFLMPNFLGFLAFTCFPVLFSLGMAFTDWTVKPQHETAFLWLRNFVDLLGVRPVAESHALLAGAFVFAVALTAIGTLSFLWAVVSNWRGARLGGMMVTVLSLVTIMIRGGRGGQDGLRMIIADGVMIAALLGLLCGVAVAFREGTSWAFGKGTVPACLLLVGVICIRIFVGPMFGYIGVDGNGVAGLYELRDPRFWKFFYNTLYLMLGIPFAILGSLAVAMSINNELPLGKARDRLIGVLICLVCGAVSLALIWRVGYPNVAFIAAIFWLVAALGMAFNVVSFRTLYYLPTFTAGVALMILWKALYNPESGPINMGLEALGVANPPTWLSDYDWAKPALVMMGVWTAIGGTNMLLYLAALANLPQHLMDSASVDGAGWWERFRHVIWPQLAPTTFFITVMSVIGGLQGGFEQARVMTGGGPAGSTTTLAYYIYNKAFEDLELGYAAAVSWILFAIIFLATLVNWRFGKEIEV